MSNAAIFIESNIFPWIFIYFIYQKWQFFHGHGGQVWFALQKLFGGDISVPVQNMAFGGLANFFALLLNVTMVVGLLVRRNLKRGPQGFQEIFVPLLSTFFFLAYNFAEYLSRRT